MKKKSILPQHSEPLQNKKKYIVVCFCAMSGLLCSLAYSHLGADFGGISIHQFYGFIFSTTASILQLIVGVLACLYFARSDTSYRVPLTMMIIMFIQLIFCFVGIIYFICLSLPNKSQVKEFVITNESGKFNGALMKLEEEMHCCGVDSYEDYRYSIHGRISWEVPSSCCRRDRNFEETNCHNPQNLSINPPDYIEGCFSKINDVSELQELAPSFYMILNACRFLVLGLFLSSIIFIVTLYGYYHLFYKRHKSYTNTNKSNTSVNPSTPNTGVSVLEHGEINQSNSNNIDSFSEAPNDNTIISVFASNNNNINNNNHILSNGFLTTDVANNSKHNSTSNLLHNIKINNNNNHVNVEPQLFLKSELAIEKIEEFSIERLPGSLSELSAYIYPQNIETRLNLRNNRII